MLTIYKKLASDTYGFLSSLMGFVCARVRVCVCERESVCERDYYKIALAETFSKAFGGGHNF